jgi:hypothetical protein
VEHIHCAKVDLADGYWRMIVKASSRWNFAFVLPGPPGSPAVRLVLPSALQMGWNESPAYLCAATETAHDCAQAWIDQDTKLPPHPLQPDTQAANSPRCQTSDTNWYQMSAVYVDKRANFWKNQGEPPCMPSTAYFHCQPPRTHQGQKTQYLRRS